MAGILDGGVALVTGGGGQGVGQGIARALAGAGAKLIIAQRSKEQGEAEATYLRDRHGVEALFVATDVVLIESGPSPSTPTGEMFTYQW